MEFHTIQFAVLFSIVFLLYWFPLRRNLAGQNILILSASYIFYAYWDWKFLSLIIFTTLSTYYLGIATVRVRKYAKLFTGINIVVNLLILIAFKYFNFFQENLAVLLRMFGMQADWVFLDILLPVGISFYTFQAIGYSVDVYRGRVSAGGGVLPFATFIAFFPQLVAGPIEKASQLLVQISRPRDWNYEASVSGMRRFLWGLVKKIVVADSCGFYADRMFAAHPESSIHLAVGTILFTIQIYCDFSGYCDMAQGLARMLGIRLMDNFRTPYVSRSVLEFWRRWHISLMEWFRDYVYIPLGGSRKGKIRTFLNIAVVFLLSGLWHGATWTFVLWGAYWAVVYIAARLVKCDNYKSAPAPRFSDLAKIIPTLWFIMIGWLLFRSVTVAEFITCLPGVSVILGAGCLAAYLMVRLAGMIPGVSRIPLSVNRKRLIAKRRVRYSLYMLLYLLVLTATDYGQSFIYFQF